MAAAGTAKLLIPLLQNDGALLKARHLGRVLHVRSAQVPRAERSPSDWHLAALRWRLPAVSRKACPEPFGSAQDKLRRRAPFLALHLYGGSPGGLYLPCPLLRKEGDVSYSLANRHHAASAAR